MKKKTGLIIGGSLLFGGLMFYLLRRRGYTFVDTGVWCDNADCSNIDEMSAENYIEYCEDELGYSRGLPSNNNLVSCSVGQGNRPTSRSSNSFGGWTNILLDGPYAQDFEIGEKVFIEQDEESQIYSAYNGEHEIQDIKGDYVIEIDVERQGDSMPVGGKVYRKSILSSAISRIN